jgi:hypothetical protein
VSGVLQALRATNEELIYLHPAEPDRPQKIINEIAYADDQGEMQFLRRSLLAGAFKFDRRHTQVLPLRLLDYFRSHINAVTSLICIGYSFGDSHVNQVIREWLEFSPDRQLKIVGPKVESIPAFLLHLAPQIVLTSSTATDYLDTAAGIVRTKSEVLQKQLAAWARREGQNGWAKFQAFFEQHQKDRIRTFVDKLKSLPWRDGDIDLEALGLTKEEFISCWSGELHETKDDLIEAFFKNNNIKP